MKTFVLWQARTPRAARDPAEVGRRLLAHFGPLFDPEPELHLHSVGDVHLAWLELPVDKFSAPTFERDEQGWGFSAEHPLNGRRALRAGGRPLPDAVLPALGRELEARPEETLAALAAPFSLVWAEPARGEVRVQTDALGQAQLFEHDGPELWALGNRVGALPAAGVELVPEPVDWALRYTLGWFPEERSGYRGVRLLPGGTRVTVRAGDEPGRGAVRHEHIDALARWVRPEARSVDDALELGRQGLLDHVEDTVELARKPSVGLSGGWDSRVVMACLRTLGAKSKPRVRGPRTNYDVLISAELARIADLPLRIKTGGGVPPASAEACRASIEKALRWQGGGLTLLKHKTFLAKAGKHAMDGGVVNLMGQHGGVGKADFAVRINARERDPATYEDVLLESLMKDAPAFLRPELRDEVEDVIRRSYRKADRYELEGEQRLHFYFLDEYTRRWGAATVNSQTGVVATPFLAPDVIRAAYCLPPALHYSKPIHAHALKVLVPDWAHVPFTDTITEEHMASGVVPRLETGEEQEAARAVEAATEAGDTATKAAKRADGRLAGEGWQRTKRFSKYDRKAYWREVGAPLVQEALDAGGFWTELFDPDQARQDWNTWKGAADVLVVSYLLEQQLAD